MTDEDKFTATLRKPSLVIGLDPGINLGFVLLRKTEEGYAPILRKALVCGQSQNLPLPMKEYYEKEAVRLCQAIKDYLERVDAVVMERQFLLPGRMPLPSFYIDSGIHCYMESHYPGKLKYVSSQTIKSQYFTQEERLSYDARKKAAIRMTEGELTRIGDTPLTDHEADAYLCAYHYLRSIDSPPPKAIVYRKSAKPKAKPKPKDDDDYQPKPKRKTKVPVVYSPTIKRRRLKKGADPEDQFAS